MLFQLTKTREAFNFQEAKPLCRCYRDKGNIIRPVMATQEGEGAENIIAPAGVRPVVASGVRMRWGRFLQASVIAIVLIECAFIVRLDLLNASYSAAFNLKGSYSKIGSNRPRPWLKEAKQNKTGEGVLSDQKAAVEDLESDNSEMCSEEWLEVTDRISPARNFSKQPVVIHSSENQVWSSCGVPCVHKGSNDGIPPDGIFGLQQAGVATILRSMESSAYYLDNDVDTARKKGFTVVMTTSLQSDVPVGYFSWAEYHIMEPPQPKSRQALAAAFISNCGAHNHRLQALEKLQQEGVLIDSYGSCHQNVQGGRGVDKVEALKSYKFSLAFENSNVEDYVTEKFWQSLVAGAVPVVVGAPNIEDFAPGPNTILHIKNIEDVQSVAMRMKHLAQNATAFNESIRWKLDGPSKSFLALVDMAAVHSSCRLCIHLATEIQKKEEAAGSKRPCQCNRGGNLYHLYVRERGRFDLQSIFLKESELTEEGLKKAVLRKFTELEHVPVWKLERPEVIRGDSKLRIYRIYPLGLTQRVALYEWSFKGDEGVKQLVKEQPCLKLEVVFV